MFVGRFRWLFLVPMLALPAGCETFGLGDDEQFSVSFATGSQPSTSGQSFSVLVDSIVFGGHTLNLTNVDVVFDEVTVERAELTSGGDSDGDSDSDSDSDGPSNEKIARAGTTIALPLQGGVITPINDALPVGLYEEIELDFQTVRLRGTFDGQAFDVTVPVKTELDVRFDPPLEIDDNTDRLNVTFMIDPYMWLRRADGTLVDPRLFSTNETLRAQFVNRIRASIRAFEDGDRDADDSDSDTDSDSDRNRRTIIG
ncbi:MAG TPA: hypothetical protein VGC44_08320 [Longimicrobiales bacterium]